MNKALITLFWISYFVGTSVVVGMAAINYTDYRDAGGAGLRWPQHPGIDQLTCYNDSSVARHQDKI